MGKKNRGRWKEVYVKLEFLYRELDGTLHVNRYIDGSVISWCASVLLLALSLSLCVKSTVLQFRGESNFLWLGSSTRASEELLS